MAMPALKIPQGKLETDELPLMMGILNVTPDSFSDGGQFDDPSNAVDHAMTMINEGAHIIDIGGESTRPGAIPVPPSQQIKRVVPVIQALRRQSAVPISIDTCSTEVARAALDAGASIINDISALTSDCDLGKLAAQAGVPVILMHMQGSPRTMQQNPVYNHVTTDIIQWLSERIEYAVQCGMDRQQIIIDPGIGFGKTVKHNLQIMRDLALFHRLKCPILVGASRKSFIGKILDIDDPQQRIWGTAATVCRCVEAGVHIIRVHDVKAMAQVARMSRAML